jgi:hypothetical protein
MEHSLAVDTGCRSGDQYRFVVGQSIMNTEKEDYNLKFRLLNARNRRSN